MITYLLTTLVFAQTLVVDDSLRGSTSGTRNGGELGPDGWLITATSDHVYWHVSTLRHGAVEFSVRGLRMREDRPGIDDKAELFHMYDWTFENADTNYIGYRNNPFKHFIRKTGVLDDRPGRTDSFELLWLIGANYVEPDSAVLSWDPNTTYRFRAEWGPDGAGNTAIRTYRDGAEIMTMSEPGEWAPAGHAIRLGVARLTAESGAPLDAVFSDVQIWDLEGEPVVGVEPAPPDALPLGPVRIVGNSLVDDNGAFLGLGATYMTALWKVKNERAQLESDLVLFRSNGFNYIRALGQVGGNFWSGLEIAPVDLRNEDGTLVPAWTDYVAQLQDLLDLVFAHGMRTEITIFGGASNIEGGLAGRQTAVDLVLSAVAGREEKVILIEVANEGWQTGFPDAGGLAEMRAFADYLDARTDIPVAVTSNHGINTIEEVYRGAHADIATWHTSRDLGVDEGWGPVWDAWSYELAPGVPPISSNEPIGPGSSVASESSPIRLVMAAAFAWTAKLPMYMFHSSAGVRHLARFEDMAGLSDFGSIRTLIPGDVASWQRNDGKEAAAPFTSFAGGEPDRYWPENGAGDGCVRNIGARSGDRFVSVPIGIRPGGLTLEARQAIAFQVYDPLTGALVGDHALGAGQRITLPQGPGAYVITNVDMTAGSGGLTGEYFSGIDLSNRVLVRNDRAINFDWSEGSPASSLGADMFSVRWSGTITPRFGETYTFHTESDDGVRLWVDGQLIVDDWNLHGVIERTGTIDLAAGRSYPIVVEYFESTGFAAVRLFWSSASQAKEVVPRDRLLPLDDLDADFVRQSAPATIEVGQTYEVSITMRNAGLLPWGDGFQLDALFSSEQIPVDGGVERPSEVTFVVEMVAEQTGTYELSWQMGRGTERFGEATPPIVVTVIDPLMMTPDGGLSPPIVDPPAVDPPPPIEDPGCGCTSASTEGGGLPWVTLLLVFLLRRSRS